MFDKFRLKAALVEYKKRFVQTQWPRKIQMGSSKMFSD